MASPTIWTPSGPQSSLVVASIGLPALSTGMTASGLIPPEPCLRLSLSPTVDLVASPSAGLTLERLVASRLNAVGIALVGASESGVDASEKEDRRVDFLFWSIWIFLAARSSSS
eukprot:264714-Prymnesium_polylepis.1